MTLKRWNIKDEQREIFLDRIQDCGLSALNQLECLRFKIVNRSSVRAAVSIIRLVMDAKAQGCEVVVAGKMTSAAVSPSRSTSPSCSPTTTAYRGPTPSGT